MATIGMDMLYYSKITEDAQGEETYGPPIRLARAMQGDLSLDLAEAQLFADDGAIYTVKSFRTGTLSLGVDDIGVSVAGDLTGAEVDDNGVLISSSENMGESVAVGFRAMKPDGKYRYFWLYKVKFGFPPVSVQTKGDTITFQTPTIEGIVTRRNKPDERGQHPWKAEVTEGDAGVDATVIEEWFDEVYDPVFDAAKAKTDAPIGVAGNGGSPNTGDSGDVDVPEKPKRKNGRGGKGGKPVNSVTLDDGNGGDDAGDGGKPGSDDEGDGVYRELEDGFEDQYGGEEPDPEELVEPVGGDE